MTRNRPPTNEGRGAHQAKRGTHPLTAEHSPAWCHDCGTWPCTSTPQAWRQRHTIDTLDPLERRAIAEINAYKRGVPRICDLPEAVAT